jgi:hypothetical protein
MQPWAHRVYGGGGGLTVAAADEAGTTSELECIGRRRCAVGNMLTALHTSPVARLQL